MNESDIARFFVIALVIYGTSLHEMGHAFVATWMGDPTPGRHGRLTLNPIPHLQPVITAVVLPLIMYMSGGGLLAMAQTPVNPARMRRPLRDNALVALAGPAMNILFVGVLVGTLWICWAMQRAWNLDPDNYAFRILPMAAFWNVVLAVFNLLPFPPLDGYRVVRAVLPLPLRIQTDALERMGMMAMMIALVAGSFILSQLYMPLMSLFREVLPALGPG